MRPSKRLTAGIASAVVALGIGAGIADAASHAGATGKAGVAGQRGHGPGPGAQAIATYLGLTADQLRTQLEAGKTLADVATAQGKTVQGLEDAIVADAKTHLDADVTAGEITAAQETSMLADLTSHVADIVNHTGPPAGGPGGRGPGGPGGGPFSTAIATYLGISASDLRTALQSGKTLAQVATANGKTVQGLEDAIVADAKTHLDADVTAGKLTAAQETSMLADLTSHVADIVNHTGPPAGGPRGHGPGGFGGPGAPGGSSSSSTSSSTF